MSNPAYLSAADYAEMTGEAPNAVKRGMAWYCKEHENYVGWGLPAPRRGQVPCMVSGSPHANIRVIPVWAAERMGELA